MDKSKGDILLCRSIRKHKLWEDKPFSPGQAWVDLIMRAEFEDTKALTRVGFMELKRGQLDYSERELASDWGWSKIRVRHFISVLKSDHMIDHSPSKVRSILTITNYEEGQSFRPLKRPLKDHCETTARPLRDHSSIRKNQINQVNQGNGKARADSIHQVIEFCQQVDLLKSDAEYCWNHWESNGWTNDGRPIKDWKAAIRSWKSAGILPKKRIESEEDDKFNPKLWL